MEYMDEYSFSRPYIVGGEYILWKGKPQKGNIITGRDAYLIPFSILWCGLVLFWEFSAITSGAPGLMGLFGIPFVCVGLYMVFGRFLHVNYLRKRTAYVITNKKIIRLRGKKIDMLDGKHLPPVHVEAYKNGNGTIRFESAAYLRNGRSYQGDPWGTSQFALENVENVVQVQQAIDKMEK